MPYGSVSPRTYFDPKTQGVGLKGRVMVVKDRTHRGTLRALETRSVVGTLLRSHDEDELSTVLIPGFSQGSVLTDCLLNPKLRALLREGMSWDGTR